jgi:hypothetical protein
MDLIYLDSDSETYNNELQEIQNNLDINDFRSICSSVDSIDLEINQYKIISIKHNRNRPRYVGSSNLLNQEQYFGALAFDVVWENGNEKRLPLNYFINDTLETLNNSVIKEIMIDYIKIARKYPKNNRCCFLCYNKVYNGNILCGIHYTYNNIFNDLMIL